MKFTKSCSKYIERAQREMVSFLSQEPKDVEACDRELIARLNDQARKLSEIIEDELDTGITQPSSS